MSIEIKSEYVGKYDGVICDWDNEKGIIASVLLKNPTEEEITEMQPNAKLEVSFLPMGRVSFFAFKFGKMRWADSSFVPGTKKRALDFDLLYAEDGKVALNILGVNTVDGAVFLNRSVQLSGEIVNVFRRWVRDYGRISMTKEEYMAKLKAAYKEFDSSEAIAEAPTGVKWTSDVHPDDRAADARAIQETHNKHPEEIKYKQHQLE